MQDISKGTVSGSQLAEVINTVYRTLVPKARAEFLSAVKSAYQNSSLSTALDKIARGEDSILSNTIASRLDTAAASVRINTASLGKIIETAAIKSGVGTAKIMNAEIRGSFSFTNPRAIEYAKQATVDLASNTAYVRGVVRDTVYSAIKNGTPPYALAGRIEQVVGLTPRDANAVNTYYDGLVSRGTSLSRAQSLSKAYSQRLLKQRAENIARTEVSKAANFGQLEHWRQMKSSGLLNNANKKWITAISERTCDFCRPVNGQVVLLDNKFRLSNGLFDSPPAHPQCRCTMSIEFAGTIKKAEVYALKTFGADEINKAISTIMKVKGGGRERWPKGHPLGGKFKPKSGSSKKPAAKKTTAKKPTAKKPSAKNPTAKKPSARTSKQAKMSGASRDRIRAAKTRPNGSKILADSPESEKVAVKISGLIGGKNKSGVVVDVSGLDHKSVTQMHSSLRQSSRDFPEALKNVKRVRSYQGSNNEYACMVVLEKKNRKTGKFSDDGAEILLNKRRFSDHKALSVKLKKESAAGGDNPNWHPVPTPKGIIDHEIGHAVSYHASKSPGTRSSSIGPAGSRSIARRAGDKKPSDWGAYAESVKGRASKHEEVIAELYAMRQSRVPMSAASSRFLSGVMKEASDGRITKVFDEEVVDWEEWQSTGKSTCPGNQSIE